MCPLREVETPDDLPPEEVARSHRWHAIEWNNLAWKLSGQPSCTALEDEQRRLAA